VEQFVANQLKVTPKVTTTPDTMNAFADAFVHLRRKRQPQADTALRGVKADANFLPDAIPGHALFSTEGRAPRL